MSLQVQLDTFKEQFKKQAPAGAVEAFAQSVQELVDSRQIG
ncbi:hypothetical protein [Agarilytica rhodophyticola]|nr:hypothetical protein [Agarilytica rhodophyticola]